MASRWRRYPPQLERPRHRNVDALWFLRCRSFVGNAEAACLTRHRRGQRLPGFHGLALLARPRAQLLLPNARTEIRIVFGIGQQFHRPSARTWRCNDPNEIPPRRAGWPQARSPCVTGSWYKRVYIPVAPRSPYRARPGRRVAAAVDRRQDHGVRIRLRGIALRLSQPLRRQLRADWRAGGQAGFRSKMSFCCCSLENGSRADDILWGFLSYESG